MRTREFYRFMKAREMVRRNRAAGFPKPWTDDEILQNYKFTNVHRHHDRTSDQLRRDHYGPNFWAHRAEILMNCALFRYFGTVEFALAVGWQEFDDFDFEGIKETATERLAKGERVFTGAYVITNQGISAPKQEVVVDVFLKSLWQVIQDSWVKFEKETSWEVLVDHMRTIKGFGGSGFMTKEILLDTTYTSFWGVPEEHPNDGTFSFPTDWWSYTPVGPGARRGAARVLGDNLAHALNEQETQKVIKELMLAQGEHWLVGDKLCPHDIQFQLCEFDKYERVRLGQGRPRSKYNGS